MLSCNQVGGDAVSMGLKSHSLFIHGNATLVPIRTICRIRKVKCISVPGSTVLCSYELMKEQFSKTFCNLGWITKILAF